MDLFDNVDNICPINLKSYKTKIKCVGVLLDIMDISSFRQSEYPLIMHQRLLNLDHCKVKIV